MKKVIAAVLAAMLLLTLAACGAGEKNDASEPTVTVPQEIVASTVFTADSLYDSEGFGLVTCPETGNYRFWATGPEDVEWSVYVLDEEFPDALRYLPQAYEPSLTGDGSIDLAQGQFIYIYCSVNSLTSDTFPTDAAYYFGLNQ